MLSASFKTVKQNLAQVENFLSGYKTLIKTYLENLSLRILYQKTTVSLTNFTRWRHCDPWMTLASSAISANWVTDLWVELMSRAD